MTVTKISYMYVLVLLVKISSANPTDEIETLKLLKLGHSGNHTTTIE